MFDRTFSFCRRLVGLEAQEASSGTATLQDDRRIWVRYPAEVDTTCQPAGAEGERRFSARIRDISQGGVNLLVNRPFQPGELLSVELRATEQGRAYEVLACIVRAQEERDGEWSLGCIFSRELSNEDLDAFGAARVRPSAADQRTWVRFPVNISATYQRVGLSDAPEQPAEVLNLSASGVGLVVGEAVETGSLLSVALQGSRGGPPRAILACVVHASEQEPGRWALGCNFIRELSEEDLEALF